MPNEPRLHHFLPEAYLRRFTDERGDLWVLDRKHGIVRRQSPEVTAAERELYTLEGDSGERDRRVESALADHIDGPGQHALRVLDDGGRLSGEDAEAAAGGVSAWRRSGQCDVLVVWYPPSTPTIGTHSPKPHCRQSCGR